ncbi:MAG: hypothetical protein ACK47B_02590 [Armatimonadota bacterium]
MNTLTHHRGPLEPAFYLAERIRAEYGLSPRATYGELLEVCHARGTTVFVHPRLQRPGYYAPWPWPLILLRLGVDARVLAHELYHALIYDNERHGVVYGYPDFLRDEDERQAELFADLLCGAAPSDS